MTVQCVKMFEYDHGEEQITVGRVYLVLEVVFDKEPKPGMTHISYRIVNNLGIPCVYDESCFVMHTNSLDHMILTEGFNGRILILTHRYFADPAYYQKNVNGYWVYVFETMDRDAVDVLCRAIEELNQEHIFIPAIAFR